LVVQIHQALLKWAAQLSWNQRVHDGSRVALGFDGGGWQDM